jgi:hypothetical protein
MTCEFVCEACIESSVPSAIYKSTIALTSNYTTEVISDVFEVFQHTAFPGTGNPTTLSKSLSYQGVPTMGRNFRK